MESTINSDMKNMYNSLREIGCCKLCILRYLGEPKGDAFLDVCKTIENRGYENCSNNFKLQKSNTCVACLGLFEKSIIDQTVNKISEEITKDYFDSKTFGVAITLPVSFLLRTHALWIYVLEKFPELCKKLHPLDVVTSTVKDVWKWLVCKQIEKAISKTFDPSSVFTISISFIYDADENESTSLLSMGYQTPKGRKPKKQIMEMYSRKGVETFLSSHITTEKFSSNYSIPPKVPNGPVQCATVSLQHDSIFFAGRYNKFSRHLPQTPWIIDGVRRVDNSIQELISDSLLQLCKGDDLNFGASGREDVDVRTLGSGRPFAIEFLNPRRSYFSFDEMRAVEKKINAQGVNQVAIRDLQLVNKDCVQHLKKGEEHKTKSYCAYCVVFGPLPKGLEELASVTPLTLQQKTPVRVLHRRPVAVRQKIVHSMKAVSHISASGPNEPSFFKLYVSTQAGTYIKEFVHGDFGRTKPSLGDLLGGTSIDIIALDVENVSLDWPPEIQYTHEENGDKT